MKRNHLTLLCLVILAVMAWPLSTGLANDRHFLWEVNPGPHPVYLLGSLHLMKKNMYPLPAAILDAYRQSDRIVFETDIGAMETPEVQRQMAMLGRYSPPDTLSRHLPPQTYRALVRYAGHRGIPTEAFNAMRPWMCALTLSVIELRHLGFDPEIGIDRYFYNRAVADGKPVHYLETVDVQIELLAGMSARDQTRFLDQTLSDLDRIDTQAAEMIAAWQTGDAPRLAAQIHDSLDAYPDIRERFFTRRNRQWMRILEDLLATRTRAMVIVGAGHLTGPDGLLQMLQQKGFAPVQH